MSGIPHGARVRLTSDAKAAVVSPATGGLVLIPGTLPAGLEGLTVTTWPLPHGIHANYTLVHFQTTGPHEAQVWVHPSFLEEIPAQVIA